MASSSTASLLVDVPNSEPSHSSLALPSPPLLSSPPTLHWVVEVMRRRDVSKDMVSLALREVAQWKTKEWEKGPGRSLSYRAKRDTTESEIDDVKLTLVFTFVLSEVPYKNGDRPVSLSKPESVREYEKYVREEILGPLLKLAQQQKINAIVHIEVNDGRERGLCDVAVKYNAKKIFMLTKRKLLWGGNSASVTFCEANLPAGCHLIVALSNGKKMREIHIKQASTGFLRSPDGASSGRKGGQSLPPIAGKVRPVNSGEISPTEVRVSGPHSEPRIPLFELDEGVGVTSSSARLSSFLHSNSAQFDRLRRSAPSVQQAISERNAGGVAQSNDSEAPMVSPSGVLLVPTFRQCATMDPTALGADSFKKGKGSGELPSFYGSRGREGDRVRRRDREERSAAGQLGHKDTPDRVAAADYERDAAEDGDDEEEEGEEEHDFNPELYRRTRSSPIVRDGWVSQMKATVAGRWSRGHSKSPMADHERVAMVRKGSMDNERENVMSEEGASVGGAGSPSPMSSFFSKADRRHHVIVNTCSSPADRPAEVPTKRTAGDAPTSVRRSSSFIPVSSDGFLSEYLSNAECASDESAQQSFDGVASSKDSLKLSAEELVSAFSGRGSSRVSGESKAHDEEGAPGAKKPGEAGSPGSDDAVTGAGSQTLDVSLRGGTAEYEFSFQNGEAADESRGERASGFFNSFKSPKSRLWISRSSTAGSSKGEDGSEAESTVVNSAAANSPPAIETSENSSKRTHRSTKCVSFQEQPAEVLAQEEAKHPQGDAPVANGILSKVAGGAAVDRGAGKVQGISSEDDGYDSSSSTSSLEQSSSEFLRKVAERAAQQGQISKSNLGKSQSVRFESNLDDASPTSSSEHSQTSHPSSDATSLLQSPSATSDCRRFSTEQILASTHGFSEEQLLGRGAYGTVFRGHLYGCDVAIKKLEAGTEPHVFRMEVEILGKIRHPHIVLLMGQCSEESCIVYEYMGGGNLQQRIVNQGSGGVRNTPLQWYDRLRILSEIAGALLYMHCHDPPILHRDMKPDNILLDSNQISKIADVGLARLVKENVQEVTWKVRGTAGYIDPEEIQTGELSVKSDIYAFGLIIAQLMTGLKNVKQVHKMLEPCGHGSPRDVDQALGLMMKNLDPLAGRWPPALAASVLRMAVRCIERKRVYRPDLAAELQPELTHIAALAFQEKEKRAKEVDSRFLCPLSHTKMKVPVVAADGFTYEKEHIEKWLESSDTSPSTGAPLPHKCLTPNHILAALLENM